jgi:hypothetical protein
VNSDRSFAESTPLNWAAAIIMGAAPKTAATKIDFFRHGSFPIKIQSSSARGSRSVFFSIFRVVVFFPSTETAPVLRGWSAEIPRPSDEYALRAG